MQAKQLFLSNTAKGTDFKFGSNCHGHYSADGSVLFNSHNEEQWSFENIEDFASFHFDDNELVPHTYQFPIGEKDEDGNVVYFDGNSPDQFGTDHDEDGSTVWSSIQIRGIANRVRPLFLITGRIDSLDDRTLVIEADSEAAAKTEFRAWVRELDSDPYDGDNEFFHIEHCGLLSTAISNRIVSSAKPN